MFSAVLLVAIVSWSQVWGAPDCIFTIPSTDDPSSCSLYNLTTVASKGPYKLSAGDQDYLFGLCGYVNVSLPQHCNNLSTPAAAAYGYNGSSCYALGSSAKDSTYTVHGTVDPPLSEGPPLWPN